MSRVRLRAPLSPTRAGAFAQAEPFLAGCGFAFGLGWLWFAGLGELWREGTAAFLALRAHEGLLALSFGAGCLVFGFAAGLTHRQGPGLRSIAHGGALLCLGLPCAADVPPTTGVVLAGLAEAALGVYWLSRILALEAARAVAALAWASLASLLVAGLLCILPPGGNIVPALAGCVLVAWLLALIARPDADLTGQLAESAWGKRESALIAALGLAFFSLGVMYALPMDYRAGGNGPFALPATLLAAHLAGAALAVPVLSPNWMPLGPASCGALALQPHFLCGEVPGRVLFTVVCALCCAGFFTFLFPSFAPLALEPASAFLEAAGLGTFAALVHRFGRAASYTQQVQAGGIPRLAGFFLAALSLAVNAGFAAGRGIMRAYGASGTALFLAALILLLALVFVTLTATRQGIMASSVPAKLRNEIAASFNTKEQAVAALLVQGHTNKKIAEYLSVTENAVRWHIKNLNKKTGATDRRQLLDMLTNGGISS